MRRAGVRALVALALQVACARGSHAQDTTVTLRHLLSLDISRVQPFHRSYDMIVRGVDSAYVIGQRDVALTPGVYAGTPAWLLVESRSGSVAAVESLFIATDLRPMHWSSALGEARLGAEFVGDSIYGAATMHAYKQNLVVNGRPDLVVNGSMLETLLPLLPLTSTWSDSVGVFGVDLTATQLVPAELAVVAEEQLAVDSASTRASWVVALRSGERHIVVWVDKESGIALQTRQLLPSHVGRQLEYRLRPPPTPVSPPPPFPPP